MKFKISITETFDFYTGTKDHFASCKIFQDMNDELNCFMLYEHMDHGNIKLRVSKWVSRKQIMEETVYNKRGKLKEFELLEWED